MAPATISKNAKILIAVAALGYFVDVYDLILFGVVRNPSLNSLGITDAKDLVVQGGTLFNWQMFGMLLGGILWGILGDKQGRKSVLFGSILLYSVANFANGFVHDLTAYAILRFIAGIGLAGELGAGITLVNETLPREKRGIGTLLVAGTGALGAVTARLLYKSAQSWEWLRAFVDVENTWRASYIIGGVLGILLLLLRVGTFESKMYQNASSSSKRGDFFSLFTNSRRFLKYFYCFLIGIPVWYIVSVLIFYAPEISVILHVQGEKVTGGDAIMFGYLGLSAGDFSVGLVSQFFKSRKKSVTIFIAACIVFTLLYLNLDGISTSLFYAICFALGFFGGYWAIFVTMASEQFGTNLRATVTTTIPNFVRGAVIPITWGFQALAGEKKENIIEAALIVGMICFVLALWATSQVEETFSKDLDYVE
jgi:MFS transporter, putative metabolite:H+ symporter